MLRARCALCRVYLQLACSRFRLPPILAQSPLCQSFMNLDELDVVQLRLYRAGVPQFELFAEDPGLWELKVTRELFNIASRIMYVRRSSRIPEATRRRRRDDPVEHQRFLIRLREPNVVCGRMITHAV
jgi:hypothetical protein